MNEELRTELLPCPACQATVEAWPPDAGETCAVNCPAYGPELTRLIT